MSKQEQPFNPAEILPEIPQSEEPPAAPAGPPPAPELAPGIDRSAGNVARPPAPPIEQRLGNSMGDLLAQLAEVDRAIASLTMQKRNVDNELEDMKRNKDHVQGGLQTLQQLVQPRQNAPAE